MPNLQSVVERALTAGVMLTLDPPHDARSAGMYVVDAYYAGRYGRNRAKRVLQVGDLPSLASAIEALVVEVLDTAAPDDGSDLV